MNHSSLNSETAYLPQVMQQVGGWFTVEEGLAFHTIARGLKGQGVIVEIGSWQGKSTICLAKGSLSSGLKTPVVAIDPHVGSEEHHQNGQKVWTFDVFKKNITDFQVDSLVEPIVKMSWDAARDFNRPIEFLFIDGAHDYESVKKDIQDWFPKLVVGGTVAFHDSDWPGVMQAMHEGIYSSSQIVNIHRVLGTTFAQKVAQNSFIDRWINQLKWMSFSYGVQWRRLRKKIRQTLFPKK